MTKLRISLLCILMFAGLAACGQRGPLYLPDGVESEAPADLEEEREEGYGP